MRLRHDSLDPDLIDELARTELSFVEPLDVIILLDGKDALEVACTARSGRRLRMAGMRRRGLTAAGGCCLRTPVAVGRAGRQ